MTQRTKPISIRDVAELAGVSLGSASRVVNKAANVSETTRQKVEAAIAQLGYRPNQAARALVTSRSRTIGVLAAQMIEYIHENNGVVHHNSREGDKPEHGGERNRLHGNEESAQNAY